MTYRHSHRSADWHVYLHSWWSVSDIYRCRTLDDVLRVYLATRTVSLRCRSMYTDVALGFVFAACTLEFLWCRRSCPAGSSIQMIVHWTLISAIKGRFWILAAGCSSASVVARGLERNHKSLWKINKLSYRRGTALQGRLVMVKNGRLELGDNILQTTKHCDINNQQSNRIRWKTQNKGYYAVQGHRGRYQSKARMWLISD